MQGQQDGLIKSLWSTASENILIFMSLYAEPLNYNTNEGNEVKVIVAT